MTQELVIGVLLSGLIGLAWMMALAIGDAKHGAGQAHEAEGSGNGDEGALKHQTIAV